MPSGAHVKIELRQRRDDNLACRVRVTKSVGETEAWRWVLSAGLFFLKTSYLKEALLCRAALSDYPFEIDTAQVSAVLSFLLQAASLE